MALAEGSNTITISAENSSGQVTEVQRTVTLDTTAPVVIISSPADNFFTNQQDLTVTGSVSEDVSFFTVNTDTVAVNPDGSFSTEVTLTEGQNTIAIQASDLAGNSTADTRVVTGDFTEPELSVRAVIDPDDPFEGVIAVNEGDTLYVDEPQIEIEGDVSDNLSGVAVAVNQTTVEVDPFDENFFTEVSLDEGFNILEVLASDRAGNIKGVEAFIVTPEVPKPILTVSQPFNDSETDSASVQVSGVVDDSTGSVTLTIGDEPVPVAPDGSFTNKAYLFPGTNYLSVRAVNQEGGEIVQSLKITRNYETVIPPDPVTVAPELDSTVATTMAASTEFLYKGENAIQFGVEEGTVEAQRAGVVRGKVLDNSGDPLSGVLITIKDHPEYGHTFTRADGAFDMAVNSGGYLTVNYQKDSYLPVQRQVEVPLQDYAGVDSVVMLQLDPNVTTIEFSDSVEVARGSVMTDEDGSR